MRILLDTCDFLWFITGDATQLPAPSAGGHDRCLGPFVFPRHSAWSAGQAVFSFRGAGSRGSKPNPCGLLVWGSTFSKPDAGGVG